MTAAGTRNWIPYCGAAPGPEELLARWNFDPALLAGLVTAAWLLWRFAAPGRQRGYAIAAAGLLVLLFVSPFCALTSALFSARVTHHVLLAAAAAPLAVLALPRSRTEVPGSLALWTALSTAAFWLWHAPPLYSAALSSTVLYWTMQLSLFASAAGFWAAVRRSAEPAAVTALLVSTVQMGLLGALIAFAGTPLYEPHFFTTWPWGIAPLDDQQLAGLIMWVPAAGLYLGAALFLAHRWLAAEDGRLAS